MHPSSGTVHSDPPRRVDARCAVLLDLENLLIDQARIDAFTPVAATDGERVPYTPEYPWVENWTAEALLSEVRRVACGVFGAPADYWVAAGAPGLLKEVSFLPSMEGIFPRVVSSERDAADRYLLDIGDHLASVGFTHFVVASGDHAFTDFVTTHNATVIARSRRSLARSMREAAGGLHVLESVATRC